MAAPYPAAPRRARASVAWHGDGRRHRWITRGAAPAESPATERSITAGQGRTGPSSAGDVAVSVRDVTKRFRIYHERNDSLKASLLRAAVPRTRSSSRSTA